MIGLIDIDCPATVALEFGLVAGSRVRIVSPKSVDVEELKSLESSIAPCPLLVKLWSPTASVAKALIRASDKWGFMAMPPQFAPSGRKYSGTLRGGRPMDHEAAWRRGSKFLKSMGAAEKRKHRLVTSEWPSTIESVLGISINEHIERGIDVGLSAGYELVDHNVNELHARMVCSAQSDMPWR